MNLHTVSIARAWCTAFRDDRSIQNFAQERYGRAFSLFLGVDMRRGPDEMDTPFIVVFPDAANTGSQRASNSFELSLVVGLFNENIPEIDGISQLSGVVELDELCPLLEKAMRMALPAARVQNVSVEYDILQFPLIMAQVSVTVEETLPIGRR